MQLIAKWFYYNEIQRNLLDPEVCNEKLVIKKDIVSSARNSVITDGILEAFALGLICLLRLDIYRTENDNEEDMENENFFRADVMWMIAAISIFFSFFYDIYLFSKTTKDLDQCDFYHEKDQKTYDAII
jgi:hypothetical protein